MRPTALALFVCALAAACAHLPRAPSVASDDAAFVRTARPTAPGLAADPPEPYLVLPGDVLTLRTISVSPMDLGDIVVDPEGLLHVPLAGAVRVQGLSLQGAAQQIELKLHGFDLHARVLLTLRTADGHRATVAGAVERPGLYTLTPGMRVAELLQKCGGPLRTVSEGESVDLADLAGARLMRGGTALPVDVAQALEGGAQHDVRLHAGDVLVVPPSRGQRVSVLGEVRSPKAFPWRSGLRLTDSLAIAGGSNDHADDGDVRVVRGALSSARVYTASIKDVVRGKARDVQLEPGDVVFVTEHWFASTTDVLQRLLPVLYTFALARGYGLLPVLK